MSCDDRVVDLAGQFERDGWVRLPERIPAERLWVNPDCGLKTRQWAEVIPALTHMVAAAKALRGDAA